ncbi:MAG: zinc ribbon domain-containing protein [Thiovulaceae bacterium]|nr:zinc ribbon domain-containing protein [Sulfurimonadaceae bacterium]
MNQHLAQLVDLSNIDKEIDAFEPKIQEINDKLHSIEDNRQKIQNVTEGLQAEITDAELKKGKNELHLAELTQKLKDNSSKSAEVKNEREMKSLQLEEEIAREQITFANEEIERLDKIIENRKVEIGTEQAKLDELSAQEDEVKKTVEAELKTIEADRQKIFGNKQELVSKMNQKGLAFYEKIRRWAKNTTAVPVKKQACYGCFLKISDKVYSDVIKGEEIVTCPHCGRIIYIDPQEGDETPAA